MSELPFMPMWIGKYLSKTTHLTATEHGAYLLLLFAAWQRDTCDLPDDDRLLAKWARLTTTQWKRIKPTLAPFFVIESGTWTSTRQMKERVAVRQHRQQRSDAGKASGLKRKETGSTGGQRGGNGEATTHTHTHTHKERKAEPRIMRYPTAAEQERQRDIWLKRAAEKRRALK